MFELQRYYSWVVDRFHLSTQAYQLQTYGKCPDFDWLEDRLLPLNFRLIFLTRSPDSFARAREERLKVSGNPRQYDDLELFTHEQELLKSWFRKAGCPACGWTSPITNWTRRLSAWWLGWKQPVV